MFEKELELWGILSKDLQKRAETDISETLRRSPYTDIPLKNS